MHGPADDTAGEEIEDGNQIEPALAGEDASGIGRPDLIGSLESKMLKAVRRNRSAVVAVGGGTTIFGALAGEEALRAHEPGDAIVLSWATQSMSDSRATVGLATAGKLLPDLLT